jgi:O-antigen/teichoic acid export membrane protein
MIFQFIARSVIVYALGEEYLGLSSLFTSILQVLNVSELGFSASIIYFMYKPLAESDTERVCALLAYLRKVYKIVGVVIFGVGILITPFIPYIIKSDVPTDINIYLLYILYLVNTSVSYLLFSYKDALLTAIQRLDLTKIANTFITVIQYGLQLIALLYFRNYYLYVLALVMGTVFNNIFTAFICNKKFPQYTCRGSIDQTSKKDIITKVKGMMICNISGVTYTSLDSIIISAFVGLSSVAIYNNYILIYSSVGSLIILIRTSMQASIGNSIVTESREKNLGDMELLQFLFSILAGFCSTCMICLFQPFMSLWMGESMLLSMMDVVLIGIWFMVTVVQHAYYLYSTGNGLWDELKWAYIFSTCFNLIMNIVLGKLIGITGIILASLLSAFISGTIWQCLVLFKSYYKMSAKNYILRQFVYFGAWSIVVAMTYFVCNLVPTGGFKEFVIRVIICVIVSCILIFAFSFKTKYFKKAKELFTNIIYK